MNKGGKFVVAGSVVVTVMEKLKERVLEMMQYMVGDIAGQGHTHLPVAMESLSLLQYPVLLLNQSHPRSFQGPLQLRTLPS